MIFFTWSKIGSELVNSLKILKSAFYDMTSTHYPCIYTNSWIVILKIKKQKWIYPNHHLIFFFILINSTTCNVNFEKI